MIQLLNDLKTRQYKISRHIYFIATKPTPREIFAADFRDRVVHHLLYNEIYSIFDADFIADSYANRIGKGTHSAVKKLRDNMKQVKQESGGGWALKLDMRSFFRSINKYILYNLLEKKIAGNSEENSSEWVYEILWLIKIILFHNPTKNFIYRGETILQNLIPKHKSLFYSGDRGLPIGNLTSQFFANIYLNELDHFIVKKLGVKYYVRYVDDLVIVDALKHKLKTLIPIIDRFLQVNLELQLHPGKIRLQEMRKGVDFLGYFIKPSHILVRQKVVKRFKDRLRRSLDSDGFLSTICIPMIKSYLGHLGHASSFRLQRDLCGDM